MVSNLVKGSSAARDTRIASGLCLLTLVLIAGAGDDQKNNKQNDAPDRGKTEIPDAHLVRVPLPLQGTADSQIIRSIERWLESTRNENSRPVLVLEFRAPERFGAQNSLNAKSENSDFTRALALARFLSSDKLRRVKTVAFLPDSVKGHAVLPVIACEQIMMRAEAELGPIQNGAAGENIDSMIRQAYRQIAQRRGVVPPPIALAMIDKQLAVYRIKTLDGVRYVFQEELDKLEQEGKVLEQTAISRQGEAAVFTGEELRSQYRFVSHLAENRRQVALALGLAPAQLMDSPFHDQQRKVLRVRIAGNITPENAQQARAGIQSHLEDEKINFVLLELDTPGGDPAESEALAIFLSELDPAKVRTLAYIPVEARGDAVLIAFGCDQIVAGEQAVLGGGGARSLRKKELEAVMKTVQAVSAAKHRDWSPLAAMINPDLEIARYIHETAGQHRYFTKEEVSGQPDSQAWRKTDVVFTERGVKGIEAEALGWVDAVVQDEAELYQMYSFAQQDVVQLKPNWVQQWLEKLAAPPVPSLLLFAAWFFLMGEFMQPGLSVAGFLAAVCFVLFFWAQNFHGNAGWLEILLFGTGVVCVLIEIFLLPGIGAFGIGGGVLIVISIVLASQTFIIPQNAYQLGRFSWSLGMVIVAGAGGISGLMLMRKLLPHAPFFNRMMLPSANETQRQEQENRESLADFSHLMGKRGVAHTRLSPAGKARFGDQLVDVVSDGEWIPQAAEVIVADIRGNRVTVCLIARPNQGGTSIDVDPSL